MSELKNPGLIKTRERVHMTDWSEQITEIQRSCMEQQQKLLTEWVGALQKAGTGTPQNVWHQSIDTLEQQVNDVLDAQQQSFNALIETVEQASNVSPDADQWVNQVKASIGFWTDMQHRLWKTWFNMMRNAAPAKQEPGAMLVQNWQDFAQRAVEMQEQWLASWSSGLPGSKEPSGKRPRKPST
jgi:hypothetical protein